MLGVRGAARRPAYSIPVVFLLTEKYRVAAAAPKQRGYSRLESNAEADSRSGTQRRISSTACGSAFGLEEIELYKKKRRRRRRNETNGGEKQPLHEDEAAQTKAHYSSFSSRRARGGKTTSGRYYDECSQTGGKLLLTRNELRAYHP